MGGSHYGQMFGAAGSDCVPRTDLSLSPKIARAVHTAITSGLITSAHDCSDGGLLCALAEMLIAGSTDTAPIGASIDLAAAHADPVVAAFSESPGRYLLEVRQSEYAALRRALASVPHTAIGALDDSGQLRILGAGALPVDRLRDAWTSPLDW
jgi:phosphoribosylformylglycinamidine synthase subunit PurSL